jgi:hypothetical protein
MMVSTLDDAKKVSFRLAAMQATDQLQAEIKFDDKWRALVEHKIFDLIKRAHAHEDMIKIEMS